MAPRRRTSASSSARAPRVNTMGLDNLSNDQKQLWHNLTRPGRQILETKFASIEVLEHLDLLEPVEFLLGRVGLAEFLTRDAPTYTRHTLEFLSTLEVVESEEGNCITFNLNDTSLRLTYAEVAEAFGWDYVQDNVFNEPLIFNPAVFFTTVTNGLPWHSRCKSSALPHPALRYTHHFLSMTLLCHGETTHLPTFDLKCLWAMTPDGRGCPDWVDLWVRYCMRIARKEAGKISIGGMVTLLGRTAGEEVPVTHNGDMPPLGDPENGSHLITDDQLRRSSMLWWRQGQGPGHRTYVWLFGTHGVKYMRLPQPDRTHIDEQTTTLQLAIPPDPLYVTAVREEYGQMQQPQAEQAQAAEEAGQAQEAEAPPQPQQPPADWYAHIGQRLDAIDSTQAAFSSQISGMQQGMQEQFDSLHDSMFSMTSMVSAMNSFYVSQHPDYQDPTDSIAQSLQQRRAAREERRQHHP